MILKSKLTTIGVKLFVKFLLNHRCECGIGIEQHRYKNDKNSKNKISKWEPKICTADDGLTDAFGDVKFICNNNAVAKVDPICIS